ncbi:hypothetical protein ACUY0R_003640 [Vibrio cholerae]|nr:hypothetical protein [Vibrio cholerae]
MRGSEEFYYSPQSNNWIYIGGDIYNRTWSKVGMTTNGLNTRHTSSQNPGYFIYVAFNIIRGNVHEIESHLLNYLESIGFERIVHFSTRSKSECFWLNPDYMEDVVEDFIQRYYGSCVTYENSLHGYMSRYQCRDDIKAFYSYDGNHQLPNKPQPNTLNRSSYFTGNQEIYEIDLGDGHYIDVSSGLIKHVEDEW